MTILFVISSASRDPLKKKKRLTTILKFLPVESQKIQLGINKEGLKKE